MRVAVGLILAVLCLGQGCPGPSTQSPHEKAITVTDDVRSACQPFGHTDEELQGYLIGLDADFEYGFTRQEEVAAAVEGCGKRPDQTQYTPCLTCLNFMMEHVWSAHGE